MRKVARSNIGRNMWKIMTKFNVLPNDPRIRNMDIMTRDYILEEMQYDNEIEDQIAKGFDPNKQMEDTDESYLNKYYSKDRNVNLLEDGDDPDKIYEQVKEATKDKDYDKRLESRIKQAIVNRKSEEKNADIVIKNNWKKLENKLKESSKGR